MTINIWRKVKAYGFKNISACNWLSLLWAHQMHCFQKKSRSRFSQNVMTCPFLDLGALTFSISLLWTSIFLEKLMNGKESFLGGPVITTEVQSQRKLIFSKIFWAAGVVSRFWTQARELKMEAFLYKINDFNFSKKFWFLVSLQQKWWPLLVTGTITRL